MTLRVTGTNLKSSITNCEYSEVRLLDSLKLLSSKLKFQSIAPRLTQEELLVCNHNESLIEAAKNAQSALSSLYGHMGELEDLKVKLVDMLVSLSEGDLLEAHFKDRCCMFINVLGSSDPKVVRFYPLELTEFEKEFFTIDEFSSSSKDEVSRIIGKMVSFVDYCIQHTGKLLEGKNNIIASTVVARENSSAARYRMDSVLSAASMLGVDYEHK